MKVESWQGINGKLLHDNQKAIANGASFHHRFPTCGKARHLSDAKNPIRPITVSL